MNRWPVKRCLTTQWGCRSMPTLLVVGAVLLTVAGCGADKASVGGTVTRRDGSPVVNARVVARDWETRKAAGAITDEQGHFELGTIDRGDGIPPGNYTVMVVEDRGSDEAPRPRTIAAKYEIPKKSGLSLDIKAGESRQFDLVLDPPTNSDL